MLRFIFLILLTVIPLFLKAQGCIQIDVPSSGSGVKGNVLENTEYIPLETTPNCLIHPGSYVYVADEYIIVSHFFEKAFLFDRKTDRFIHEIGSKGQGPGEYTGLWAGLGFSEKEQLLYVWEFIRWKGYDIKTGKLKQVIKMPDKKYVIQNSYLYKPGVYLGYTNNTTGKTPFKLVVFNKDGVISKTYPNYNQMELNVEKDGYPMDSGLFYNYGSNIYFHAPRTDSIFQVAENYLIPYVCFNHPKEISIEALGETGRFIIFKAFTKMQCHIAFFDKIKKTCYVDIVSKNASEQYLYSKATIYNLNRNGEVAATLESEDVIRYLEEHPESKNELNERLLKLQEDDNPVVMILNIKK